MLKWFCEAGGSPDEAMLEQTPYTHSNSTNLALFRHKITLYRLNQGVILLKGDQMGSGGLSPPPPSPPHFNHRVQRGSRLPTLKDPRHCCCGPPCMRSQRLSWDSMTKKLGTRYVIGNNGDRISQNHVVPTSFGLLFAMGLPRYAIYRVPF